ncbi:uncharacterized protein LOC129599582 [Paramacrobiotus metropolitanus]|uniref:uncharacterized protein LOC129599582 n=1 Tax=Paramacrobiotus metropolitanus TaxID=2943436 RepID=UPI002445A5B2|nr:uncharacterized protein LOC129599582 [Paramacrobiotus metropolitanus]
MPHNEAFSVLAEVRVSIDNRYKLRCAAIGCPLSELFNAYHQLCMWVLQRDVACSNDQRAFQFHRCVPLIHHEPIDSSAVSDGRSEVVAVDGTTTVAALYDEHVAAHISPGQTGQLLYMGRVLAPPTSRLADHGIHADTVVGFSAAPNPPPTATPGRWIPTTCRRVSDTV